MGDSIQHSSSRLFASVRESQETDLSLDDARVHSRTRARLLQAIDLERRSAAPAKALPLSRPFQWRWALAPVAAAACAFSVFFAWPSDRPLEVQVDGVTLSAHQNILADDESRTLAFSDDTQVVLSPGGELHIDDLNSNGAALVLDRGEIALSVHHEDDTSWQVGAGPWTVHVTGTQFSVAWEPDAQTFAVEVREGSVRVEGPTGTVAQLGAGDRFSREPPEQLAALSPATAPQLPSVERSVLPSQVEPSDVAHALGLAEVAEPVDAGSDTGSAAPQRGAPKPSSTKKAAAPRWDDLYERGEFGEAWATVARAPGGLHGEAGRVDAPAMLDLADLARFNKSRSDARQILERVRGRFSASRHAGEAAFLLGKMAADGGDWSKAATWFETYLDEQPKGAHASDALGRLMASYQTLGRLDRAREVATDYLARQPKGAHASKARELLDQ